ncbi:MAG: hypothetical protein AAF658_15345 [Myxococcota bacterium]
MDHNAHETSLEGQMKVTFKVDELNGFFSTFAALEMDELWRILEGEDEGQPRETSAT